MPLTRLKPALPLNDKWVYVASHLVSAILLPYGCWSRYQVLETEQMKTEYMYKLKVLEI